MARQNIFVVGQESIFEFNVTGKAQDSYILGPLNKFINIKVIENKVTTNYINVTLDPTSIDQISANIIYQCGQLGFLYYHIARDY